MRKITFWPEQWHGRITVGIVVSVLILFMLVFLVKWPTTALVEYSNAAQRATTNDQNIAQQFAVNVARTWKVAEKYVTREGLNMTYEYVLISGRDRIVIRKNMAVPESSDIIVGDTVKLTRDNNIYGDAYNHPNDPTAYYIERVKNE